VRRDQYKQEVFASSGAKTIRKRNHKNGVATLAVCKADKPPFCFFLKKVKKSTKNTLLNVAVFNLLKKRVLNSLGF
jgi:hypothetical protein